MEVDIRIDDRGVRVFGREGAGRFSFFLEVVSWEGFVGKFLYFCLEGRSIVVFMGIWVDG